MNKTSFPSPIEPDSGCLIIAQKQFTEWFCINDTIMGGLSEAACSLTSDGLVLSGDIIEDGGGVVSCCSPQIDPP